jgi:hypothetical protein
MALAYAFFTLDTVNSWMKLTTRMGNTGHPRTTQEPSASARSSDLPLPSLDTQRRRIIAAHSSLGGPGA